MKRLALLLALSALTVLTAAAQILTDFGSASFTPDYDLSNFDTIIPASSSITVEGLDDGQTLAGYFTATLDFSAVTTLYLTASVQGPAPDSLFTVLLFNSDFSQTRTYQNAFNAYGSAPASIGLTLVSENSAFTDIAGFQIIGSGLGATVNFTLGSLALSPVPEPASAAALAALAALGLAATRRRRRAAA